MATALNTLSNIVSWVYVALGLGFVIFVHELGHFLLAKWNGVKVERFSIGFGPTLASWRKGVGLRIGTGSRPPGPGDPQTWGETEYVLAALPLGGYVLMLGEDPEPPAPLPSPALLPAPTHAQAGVAEPIPTPPPASDPRSFANKSVWARMQIITAGVIMNIILAIICFTYVFTLGGETTPADVGAVLPGKPAYRAGLRPGDKIVAIDGRRDVIFKDLKSKVNLSEAGQKVRFTVVRPGVSGEIDLQIEPSRDDDALTPTIGVVPELGLKLSNRLPFLAPLGEAVDPSKPGGGFLGRDRVVAVGPEGGELAPVADHQDYLRKSEALRGRPMVVEVESAPAESASEEKDKEKKAPARRKVTVPVHKFVDVGLRLGPGAVEAIRPGSPAERAGIKPGDRIVAVAGDAKYDPMTLPDVVRRSAGRPLKLEVERAEGGKLAKVEVEATPDDSPAWVDNFIGTGALPLDVPGLGLALDVGPKVASVVDGSPASRAGIKPGATLKTLILTRKKVDDEDDEPLTLKVPLDGKVGGWPVGFATLQLLPWTKVELAVDDAKTPVEVKPEVDPDRDHPYRGLRFEGLARPMPPLGLASAFRKGCEETLEQAVSTLLIPQRMIQRRIGNGAVGGVIPIFQIAHDSVVNGWLSMLQFFGALSVGLAVLNFLPIPPLDGGQFLLLAAEKVRGKPLPDPLQNALKIGGLVFVLALIVVINGRDLFNLVARNFFGG